MQQLNKNTLFFLFILLSFSNTSLTQSSDFDMDYLNSLPESVRIDVESELAKQKDNKENEKPFLNPSSKLNKSQTITAWEAFKKQNSLLEDSERYGMRLFNTMQSSFMPVNEPNFDASYVLDSGDTLSVDIYESSFDKYILDIKRDGSITVPGVGKIFVAGLELSKAIDLVSSRINKILVLDSIVSLESVRDIQILMTGNIYFPGIYTFNGNTNPLHAISMAGGIKETGSFREILIKRKGEVINTIDLYDALIFGNTSFNISLRSGDTILISSVKNLIRAGSGFSNHGLFELVDGESLDDLIQFAGGLSAKFNASKNKLSLDRIDDNGIFKSSMIDLNKYSNFKLKNFDSLRGQEISIRSVRIEGAVVNEGSYSINVGETLSSLISRAGGYTANAYPFGGIHISQTAKKLEQIKLDVTYNTLINYLASSSMNNSSQGGSSLPLLLAELKNKEASGRVVSEFDELRIKSGKAVEVLLDDKDHIYIPSYKSTVFVYGEVNQSGGIPFNDSFDAIDYIDTSGGLSKYADKKFIYVVDPNGIAKKLPLANLSFINRDTSLIYPGSIIYVPRNVEFRDDVEFLSLISPVFSSLAVSIASLNAISSN